MVFDYGDKGREFFSVMEGQVNVSIPFLNQISITPEIPNIIWRSLKNTFQNSIDGSNYNSKAT